MLDVLLALWQPAVRGGASSLYKRCLEDAVVVYGINYVVMGQTRWVLYLP